MGTSTVSGPFRSQNGFQELDGNGDWVAVGGGAVDSVSAGTGISVNSPTGAVVVTNAGVTSAVAGSGITVSSGTGAVTITNSGIRTASAGTGISTTTVAGALTIGNTGVTSIVAGTNVTISGSTGAVTINAAGGGGGGATIITANVALEPNGTNVNITIPNPTTGPVAAGTIYRFNIEQRFCTSGDTIPSVIFAPSAGVNSQFYGTVLQRLSPAASTPSPDTGNTGGTLNAISYLRFTNFNVQPVATFGFTSGAISGQIDLTYLGLINDPATGPAHQYNINGITNAIQY